MTGAIICATHRVGRVEAERGLSQYSDVESLLSARNDALDMALIDLTTCQQRKTVMMMSIVRRRT